MKASHKTAQNDTYQSRPLAPEQLNAITYLCTGMTDAEVAAAVGCQRETVWRWRNTSPDFMAELEKARQQFMSGAVDKLRSTLPKAVQNVVDAINTGDLKASLALLKCVGLEGSDYFKPGETDASSIALKILLQKLANEQIPEKEDFLIGLNKNPRYEARKREILEELGRGDEIA
jgi:Helix-turn-helix of insertion element transposase